MEAARLSPTAQGNMTPKLKARKSPAAQAGLLAEKKEVGMAATIKIAATLVSTL